MKNKNNEESPLRVHIIVDETMGGDKPVSEERILIAVAEKIWSHFIDLDIDYAYQRPEAYKEWASKYSMGKIAHRVKNTKEFNKIKEELESLEILEDIFYLKSLPESILDDTQYVLVTKPISKNEQPKKLKSLQLEGWKAISDDSYPKDISFLKSTPNRGKDLSIAINSSKAMSLGKKIAAIAHVAQLLAEDRSHYIDKGYSSLKLLVRPFKANDSNIAFTIRDKGFTEVDEGYPTAALMINK